MSRSPGIWPFSSLTSRSPTQQPAASSSPASSSSSPYSSPPASFHTALSPPAKPVFPQPSSMAPPSAKASPRVSAKPSATASVPANARPMHLVSADADGKLHVDPAALSMLRGIKGPLGVAAVCGRARQGKSYILNQILGSGSGFQVSPTHKPCTKGIWIWSSPLAVTTADGFKYSLLLLDTEGIDAFDQTGTYSTQIFSLSLLLSSLFIYNQMGGIDEAAIDRLALVAEMATVIRGRSEGAGAAGGGGGGGGAERRDLGSFSPNFIWLLRDFFLDLNEEGQEISPIEYLEGALRPLAGSSKAVRHKNQLRETIKALFPSRDCLLLKRPLLDERELQRLDSVPASSLRPEFRDGIQKLLVEVWQKARPKRVAGAEMTGKLLAGLAEIYVDAINGGAVPDIMTSWQSVEDAENRKAMEAAREAFVAAFGTPSIDDDLALLRHYDTSLACCLAAFQEAAIGSESARKQREEQLRAAVAKIYEEFKSRAKIESDANCLSEINTFASDLATAARGPPPPPPHILTERVRRFASEFEAKPLGPSKWKHLSSFLQTTALTTLSDCAGQGLADRQRQVAEAERATLAAVAGKDAAEAAAKKAEEEKEQWRVLQQQAARDKEAVERKVAEVEREREEARKGREKERERAELLQLEVGRVKGSSDRERDRWQEEKKALSGQLAKEQQGTREALQRALQAEEEVLQWKGKHAVAVREGEEREALVRREWEGRRELEEQKMRIKERASEEKLKEKDRQLAELNRDLQKVKMEEERLQGKLTAAERDVLAKIGSVAAAEEELQRMAAALQEARSSAQLAEQNAAAAAAARVAAEADLVKLQAQLVEVEAAKEGSELKARTEAELLQQARLQKDASERERARAVEVAEREKEHVAALERQLAEEAKRSQDLEAEIAAVRLQETERAADLRQRQERMERELELKQREVAALREELRCRKRSATEAGIGIGGEGGGAGPSGDEEMEDAEQTRARKRMREGDKAEDKKKVTWAPDVGGEGLMGEEDEARAEQDGHEGPADEAGEKGDDAETEGKGASGATRGKTGRGGKAGGRGGRGKGKKKEVPEEDVTSNPAYDEAKKMTVMQLRNAITERGHGDKLLAMRSAAKRDLIDLFVRYS